MADKKEAVRFIDLRQRHIEAFSSGLPDPAVKRLPEWYGDVVRSAARAGWFDPPLNETEVGEMLPSEVNRIYAAVMKEYNRIETTPPE